MFLVIRNADETIFRVQEWDGSRFAPGTLTRGERTLEVHPADSPEVAEWLKAEEERAAAAEAEAARLAAAAEAERARLAAAAEEAARAEAKRAEEEAAAAEALRAEREAAAAKLEGAAAVVQAALAAGKLDGPEVAEAYATIALAGAARLRG